MAAFVAATGERLRRLLPRPWGVRAVAAAPDEAMFARIRRRLTWWYSLVLLGALLLSGAALYTRVRAVLFDPVDGRLSALATRASYQAQCFPPAHDPGQFVRYGEQFFIACFDTRGTLQQAPGDSRGAFGPFGGILSIAPPQDFPSEALARRAIRAGADVTDIADLSIGPVKRYAARVRNLAGRTVAVVEIGTPIGGETLVLQRFLELLLGVGALAVLAAALGGLFLARRALEPARLAFARQQSFIADASHELRTPLTLLRADAEVLLRGGDRLTSDDRALLEDIVSEAEHMTALAGAMLTLARLDADQRRLERDVVDLAALAARVAQRAAALAREKGVAIDAAGADDGVGGAAPVLVIGDRLLLEQVALILVDNAIKYNRPGGRVVVRAGQAGDEATLEVCDTGIGIAGEHLPHLGERFYRVDKARAREAGGAGLGLSIARGVAAAHGGALILSSTPGAGTVARLRLPLLVESRKSKVES